MFPVLPAALTAAVLWRLWLLPASPHGQLSPLTARCLPTIPPPTTWRTPAAAFARYPSARQVPFSG